MSKVTFNLIDRHFAHIEYTVPGVEARLVKWDRQVEDTDRPTFFSHEDMYLGDLSRFARRNRFGLLIESQGIIPRVYRRVGSVIDKFELVFTHSSRLLRTFPNTRWIPGGGVWVGGTYGGGTTGVGRKSRGVSMLSSNKLSTPLHRARFYTALRLQQTGAPVDVYRQSLRSNARISVNDTVGEYRYSICIENFIDDGYFTEKLLNCLAVGTVPVYRGARRVSDYFDERGLVTFRNHRDLVTRVLPSLNVEDYGRRIEAIVRNADLALKYRTIEDFVAKEYFGLSGS